jgi:hypothetical protein
MSVSVRLHGALARVGHVRFILYRILTDLGNFQQSIELESLCLLRDKECFMSYRRTSLFADSLPFQRYLALPDNQACHRNESIRNWRQCLPH